MHTVRSLFATGTIPPPLRIQNTFANECFMDELCAQAKADPVDFRLHHLENAPVIGVIKAVANATNWEPCILSAAKTQIGGKNSLESQPNPRVLGSHFAFQFH
jgi:hypothetical protein